MSERDLLMIADILRSVAAHCYHGTADEIDFNALDAWADKIEAAATKPKDTHDH